MRTFTLVFILCLLSICSTNGYSQETIRLTTGEWPPFLSNDLKHQGFYAHIVSRAFEEVGVKVDYQFLPWKRAVLYAGKGTVNGTLAYFRHAEREKKFFFSDPIGHDSIMLFHLKSYNFAWETEADLQEIHIGATSGYHTLTKLQELNVPGKKFFIHSAPSDLKNLQLLLRGRIQLFACSREVGLHLINSHFSADVADTITYHNKPFYSKSLHIMFPKHSSSSTRFLSVFNEGLQRLYDSGKYKQLMADFENGMYVVKPGK